VSKKKVLKLLDDYRYDSTKRASRTAQRGLDEARGTKLRATRKNEEAISANDKIEETGQ
jgi:hypothetical protein